MVDSAVSYPIINPVVETYLFDLFQGSDEQVLREMEALSDKLQFPIVGRLSGIFLETMALSIGAKRVFEFGSGYGYSAYWFAKAVGGDGQVVCCEHDSKNCHLAADFLKRFNLWDQVTYHNESAQDVFKRQEGEFDLIFCDADKLDYPEILDLAKTKLRKGGLYIADNVLWYGQVASESEEEADDCTAAIIRHNRLIANDPDFKSFINPIRDGLIVAIKL